jgi:hypothetical protein
MTATDDIAGLIADLFRPLRACDTAAGAEELLREAGFPDADAALVAPVVSSLVAPLAAALAGSGGPGAGQIGPIVAATFRALSGLSSGSGPAMPQLSPAGQDAAGELALRFLDILVPRFLDRRFPVVAGGLQMLGLLTLRTVGPPPGNLPSQPTLWRIRWDRLTRALTQPAGLLTDAHGGIDFDAAALLDGLGRLAALAGLPLASDVDDADASDPFGRAPDARGVLDVTLFTATDPANPATAARAGFRLAAVPATPTAPAGIALSPVVSGNARLTAEPLPGWTASVEAGAQAMTGGLAVVWRPPATITFVNGLAGLPGIPLAGAAALQLRRGSASGPRQALFGKPDGTRLDYRAITLGGEARLAEADLVFRADWSGLRLTIVPEDALLRKLLPPDGLVIDADLGLDISGRDGFRLRGGAGLDTTFRIDRTLAGMLRLDRLRVRAAAREAGVEASAAVQFAVRFGGSDAIVATAKGLGMRAGIVPRPGARNGNLGALDAYVRVKPPEGLGLKITTPVVQGGGFLDFDTERRQYSGALELRIAKPPIGLQAFGLLNTVLPDGRDGFSLVVIITADFPPIQLGAGFTLNAIGGLIGIHRSANADLLAERLVAGALDSVLFPRDVVSNAPTLLPMLASLFPVTEGRHVFGPMVKIGWGPRQQIEIDLGVLLDLPDPLRLIILGRIRMRLPDPEAAVIRLQLDMVGVIDFGRQIATVDAVLVQSRIGPFAVTGGMAALFSWGATRSFVISVGGFHPRFPALAGFRTPARLAIALSDNPDIVLRLEAYFALTANTLQFGARLDFAVGFESAFGRFAVTALLGFDALIQFSPFALTASLTAGIAISLDGTPLLSARLEATIDGPGEWHVYGFVEVQIIVKLRLPFDQKFGRKEAEQPQLVDLRQLFLAELQRPENWYALPPDDSARAVTLRSDAGAAQMPLHPLGQVALRQKLAPFRKELSRFGPALLQDGPESFDLAAVSFGGGAAAYQPLLADFAPAQFDDLTDDERLSRPSFEPMMAGAAPGLAGLRLPAAASGRTPGVAVTPVDLFDDCVIDGPGALPWIAPQPVAQRLPDALAAALGPGPAPVRPEAAVRILPERFVLTDAATLMQFVEGAEGQSHAEIADQRRRHPLGEAGTAIVPVQDAG